MHCKTQRCWPLQQDRWAEFWRRAGKIEKSVRAMV